MPRYTNDPAENPDVRTTHDPTSAQGDPFLTDAGISTSVFIATGTAAIAETASLLWSLEETGHEVLAEEHSAVIRLLSSGLAFQEDAFQPDAFHNVVSGNEALVDQGTSDVVLRQPRGGYPFQLDAFQLDAFASGAGSEAIVDQVTSDFVEFVSGQHVVSDAGISAAVFIASGQDALAELASVAFQALISGNSSLASAATAVMELIVSAQESLAEPGESVWIILPLTENDLVDSGESAIQLEATGTSESQTPVGGGIVRSSHSQFRPIDLRQRGTVTITLTPSGTSTLEWAFEDEDELLLLI